MSQYEGRNAKVVFVEETTLGTKPGTPTGFALPFTRADFTPGDGFVDFEEIDATTTPPTPMASRHSPSARFTFPLHWDAFGHVLQAGLGVPTTTGSDPYTHAYVLGHTNGEIEGTTVERQQNDATTQVSRCYVGGRVNQFVWNMALEGAVSAELQMEFMECEDWNSSLYVSSPTSYTSDAIDEMIAVLKVGGTAVGYVAAFGFTVDWRLGTDVYPVGNAGMRYSLPRSRTRVNGTLDAFLNDAGVTALVDTAEAGTAVNFDIEYVETAASLELKWDINNALLKITGEPIDTSGGLNVTFDWRASGASCISATLINSVASY